MVLAAAGRIEHDWLVERAESLFSGLSPRGEAAPQPASYAGGELIEARQLEQAHIVLGFPGVPARDPRIYTAAVLSTLLGGGMSSRLFQEVREKRGLVYSIYTFVSHFKDGGLFSLYAGTGESEAAELMPVVAEELAKAAQRIEPEEIQRAVAQVRATLLMARESTGARAEALAGQIATFGRPLSTEEILTEIGRVDVESVQALAHQCFTGTPTLVAIGPISEVEPLERFARRLA
jgi:predicted Zn-dependent peptidase